MNTSTSPPELCKGCWAAHPDEVDIRCSIQPEYNNRKCSCITCLVKMTCDATHIDCELFFEFAQYQYRS